MRNLPLKSQILLAPAVTIVLIMGLIGFTLAKITDIKQQNESVRELVRICEHAQGAITASERMNDLARKMEQKPLNSDDDLHFSYLEQSRILSEHLQYPGLKKRVTPDTLIKLQQQELQVSYMENLDPVQVKSTFDNMIPQLESLYRSFWTQKRAAYENYYNNVNYSTSRLVNISLSILAFSALVGIALSVWTFRKTKHRLGAVAGHARAICAGNLESTPEPIEVRDELDELAFCMSRMTQKLINVVATEKVLEGAEEERKRIAMDMHDQVLSDLTLLTRELHKLREAGQSDCERHTHIQNLQNRIDELSDSIRRIIDDLHPQVLDMLGLEEAIRAHIEKRYTGQEHPEYFLHIDRQIETHLSDFQLLSLFRIVQEVVNNIIRHAHCSRFEIECRENRDLIHLIIEDNGTGMEPSELRQGSGHGIVNIEERAKAIGAQIHWARSRFSSGTRFELQLPISHGTV